MDLEPLHPERAVELYLDYRRNEVASARLRSHRSRLSYFDAWCQDQGIENTNNLTGRLLYEYWVWRRKDGNLSRVSVKTQMVTIRVFVKLLESIEAVEPNLHTKVQLPSLAEGDNVRTEMLEVEEAKELLRTGSQTMFRCARLATEPMLRRKRWIRTMMLEASGIRWSNGETS